MNFTLLATTVGLLCASLLSSLLFASGLLGGKGGNTGLEILLIPLVAVQGAVAGGSAGVAAALLKSKLPLWEGRFWVMLLTALLANLLMPLLIVLPVIIFNFQSSNFAIGALYFSGPFVVGRNGITFNPSWLLTLPGTVFVCSPFFRRVAGN